MDSAYILLAVWALIGALAGGLMNDAPRDRVFIARVVDGALGGCVAGSLFYKLDLDLPFYFGSLLSAVVGGIIVVIVFDRLRTS
jgi:uncharacterized membrane protein YeaQ/YmgE (transglycosylase-associated protein family)